MSLEAHDGITLHVERLGENGSPVVMLHGLFVGSMATWYFTAAPALAPRHRVVLYDLRGHGKSERAASGYDVVSMGRDLASVARGFEDEKISLVGHSYGAVVALTWALANPTRVEKLVLVDAPLPPSRLAEMSAFAKLSLEDQVASLPAELTSSLANGRRRAKRLVEHLRFLAKNTSLLADLRGAEDVTDAALATLACETTCIYGATSSCLPVGERIARVAPRARLVTIAGGHFLPIENPSALTAEIVNTIDGGARA